MFEFKLNVPKNMNSLDLDMIHKMLKKVKEWHEFPEKAPKVVMISGVGDKAFCAGGDIKSIYYSAIGESDPRIKFDFCTNQYLLDYQLTLGS